MLVPNSLATGPWWAPGPGASSAPLPAKPGPLNECRSSKLRSILKLLFFTRSPPAKQHHSFPL